MASEAINAAPANKASLVLVELVREFVIFMVIGFKCAHRMKPHRYSRVAAMLQSGDKHCGCNN
jgi:hypothetical protein